MYRTLPRSAGNVLGYHCSGRITEAEVKEIHREIRDTLDEHGSLRILLLITDLDLPEAKAVWEDLKLTSTYLTDVERYAIAGDARWQDWLTTLTSAITKGEARFFSADELDLAWAWIES
jgi:hypothetical protein